MTARFAIVLVAGAAFALTFLLCGWQQGLWRRSAEASAVAIPFAAPPVPEPAFKDDQPVAARAALAPAPATLPPAPPAQLPAAPPDDNPAAAPELSPPPASERDVTERQREDGRGARTR
jgi:hypothetical protein